MRKCLGICAALHGGLLLNLASYHASCSALLLHRTFYFLKFDCGK